MLKRLVRTVAANAWWAPRAPFLSAAPPAALPSTILFVCKGNICRSPFAERLAANFAARLGYGDLRVMSAGLHVPSSRPATEQSVSAARAHAVDLSEHRSRVVSEDLVVEAGMIVAMEPWQVLALRRAFPPSRGTIHLMSAFLDPAGTNAWFTPRYWVPDPFGGSDADYARCFETIEQCVARLFAIPRTAASGPRLATDGARSR